MKERNVCTKLILALIISFMLVVLLTGIVVALEEEFISNSLNQEITRADLSMPESQGYIIQFKDKSVLEERAENLNQIKQDKEKIETSNVLYKYTIGQIQKAVLNNREGNVDSNLKDYKEDIINKNKNIKDKIKERLNKDLISDKNSKITGNVIKEETEIQVMNEFIDVFNGIALDISDEEAQKIKELEDVKEVYPNFQVKANLMDSVPLIQGGIEAGQLDEDGNDCSVSGKECLTGEGITIAIIDTGIDYTHEDLGSCSKQLYPNCAETDGGINIFVKSTILGYSASPETCVSNNKVVREFCCNCPSWKSSSGRQLHHKDFTCPTGTTCSNGACVGGTPVCEPKWGCVDLSTKVYLGTDCSLSSETNCPNGCFEGECIELNPGCSGDGTCIGGSCKVLGGYNFIYGNENPMDNHGHGTHVAGIAAGNGVLRGVAPDTKLYSYKVLDKYGIGYISYIISAIDSSVNLNGNEIPCENDEDYVDIISLSLGGYGKPDDPVSLAIDVASVCTVAVIAAGNEGPSYYTIGSPGTAKKAITVGASYKKNYEGQHWEDQNPRIDQITSFSSRGPTAFRSSKPDIVAPGAIICSSQYDNAWDESKCDGLVDEEHVQISGTSMATPYIAGVVAILKQAHPDWTPSEIKMALKNSAIDINENNFIQGAGRVNLAEAIKLQNPPPIAEIISSGEREWNEIIDILGTASGRNFDHYTIFAGMSKNSQNWIELGTFYSPVEDEILLKNFDLSSFDFGELVLKIEVYDSNGDKSEDKSIISISSAVLEWETFFGEPPGGEWSYDDRGFGIDVDSDGNVYVSGVTAYEGTIGPNGDLNYDRIILKYDSDGEIVWKKTSEEISSDHGRGVYVHDNSVYEIGISAIYIFQGGVYHITKYTTNIIKYDLEGNLLWEKEYAGGGFKSSYGVGVDSEGNVYVAGTAPSAKMFLLKYDLDGNLLWERTTNGVGKGLDIDKENNIYVVGSKITGSDTDLALWKYNSNGDLSWEKTINRGQEDLGEDVDIDFNGNIYVTGIIDSNPDPLYVNDDLWLLKFDSSGNLIWDEIIGGSWTDNGYGIFIDDISNSIYVAGSTESIGLAIKNAWLLKYDLDGNLIWDKTFGEEISMMVGKTFEDLVVSGGNIYAVGNYLNFAVMGISNIYITKLNEKEVGISQCGNNLIEDIEECDGTDDTFCPGNCLSDCTCLEETVCTDSDGDIERPQDFKEKGTCTDSSGISYTDDCTSNQVNEYECNDNDLCEIKPRMNGCKYVFGPDYICDDGACVLEEMICTPNCVGKECGGDGCEGSCGSCSSDETCTEGICVANAPTFNCIDTDDGDNFEERGTCTDSSGISYTDDCINDNQITEYKCNAEDTCEIIQMYNSCVIRLGAGYICDEGACVEDLTESGTLTGLSVWGWMKDLF